MTDKLDKLKNTFHEVHKVRLERILPGLTDLFWSFIEHNRWVQTRSASMLKLFAEESMVSREHPIYWFNYQDAADEFGISEDWFRELGDCVAQEETARIKELLEGVSIKLHPPLELTDTKETLLL